LKLPAYWHFLLQPPKTDSDRNILHLVCPWALHRENSPLQVENFYLIVNPGVKIVSVGEPDWKSH